MTDNRNSMWEQLRGYHWYELMRKETGFGQTKINLYPNEEGADSKRATAWKNRKETPSNLSVGRLRDPAPKSAEYYRTAPYRLFADEALSSVEIDGLLSVYRHDSDEFPYRFPVDAPITDIWCWDEPCRRADSASLAKRGDIYGFFAILALVREAEAKNEFQDHIFHLRNLCQCLPILGRFEWLRRDFGLLCRAVRQLRDRVDNTKSRLGIYWYRIEERFFDPSAQPNTLYDAVDPSTLMPAGLPNMTYVATATDMGEPPAWPNVDDVPYAGFSSMTANDLPYSVASELCAEKALLAAFGNMTALWELPGHIRAACLGVAVGDLASLFGDGDKFLTDRHKTRIAVTLALLDKLGEKAQTINDCGYILRRPLDQLAGDCILSALAEGRLFEVADALDVPEFRDIQESEFCTVAIQNMRACLS